MTPGSVDSRAFSIRQATLNDAPGMLDCLREAFAPYERDYSADGFKDTVLTPETIARRLSEMHVLVATTPQGDVIGTIGCSIASQGEGHLRGMAVRRAWQGSHVAAELLAAAESELRRNHCDHVTLDTTRPLVRAIRFYESNGYVPTGRIGDFFGMELLEYRKALA